MKNFKIFYESPNSDLLLDGNYPLTHTHACTHTYTYTCTCTHTHTHTHTQTHTHTHQIKKFRTEIYRYMLIEICIAFFFLTLTRNIFWLCCISTLFVMLSELRFVRLRFFEPNYIKQWVIIFARFCWFWYFLPKNLKLVHKLQVWGF